MLHLRIDLQLAPWKDSTHDSSGVGRHIARMTNLASTYRAWSCGDWASYERICNLLKAQLWSSVITTLPSWAGFTAYADVILTQLLTLA